MDISVVVPVHNELENIEPLVGDIVSALDGRFEYEIIYVDDASTDGTAEKLAALCERVQALRYVRLAAQCGQSTAILVGVRAARAPWIATLDGDGQNDPQDIPELLDALGDSQRPEGLKMVAGIRRQRHDSWLRRVSSRIANGIRSRLLGDDVSDTGCGLKLVERETFLALPFFDHFHRFLPALVQRAGGAVLTRDVRHRPRLKGTSKYGVGNRLWVGIVDLLGVMWLKRRAKVPVIEKEGPS